jgi:L-2-hydroxyglutarate oxidase LhgO
MEGAIDVLVIGAGVVGAAVAQRLAAREMSCVVIDRRARTGGEITERNSGVVHAGLYYPRDSLKTRLCVRGNRLTWDWAERTGVRHARTKKLIVAADEEEAASLEALISHGVACGVPELALVSKRELAVLEPEVRGVAALCSGSTGIIDPAELTASLIASARAKGAEVAVGAEVTRIDGEGDPYTVRTTQGDVIARAVVNAAGLDADEIARRAGIDRYTIHPCRGDYYRSRRPLAVRHLVYPVKTKGAPGLGVHVVLDLEGGVSFGPDANYVKDKRDYASPPDDKRARFGESVRKLFPAVADEDLEYSMSGIRPKLRAPLETEERDFVISEDLPRFVDLVGIESPGLTSALAIAEEVERILLP